MKTTADETIATKVSPDFKARFVAICKRKGINTYKAIQMMADTFVRYTDDRHNLTAEMEQAMALFEHLDGWDNALNFADHTAKKQIDEAIYLLAAEGKRGSRAVLVRRPYMGQWTETANIQQILERIIEVLAPERYRRLRGLAVDMGCRSILELLDTMIANHTAEAQAEDFRREFEDCNRHDFGKPIEYGQRTKRKHHKSVDMYEQERTIHFAPDDVPDTSN